MTARCASKWILVSAAWICLIAANTRAATIGGRVWIDTNRNGIYDLSEPASSNSAVQLLLDYETIVDGVLTDENGFYHFDNPPVETYFLKVTPPIAHNFSMADIGDNDDIDNDFSSFNQNDSPGYSDPFAYTGESITNIDAGIFPLVPGISTKLSAGNALDGQPLYVSNGTPVAFTFKISNTGETMLSYILIFDLADNSLLDSYLPPYLLFPGSDITYTNQQIVDISITNNYLAVAAPVHHYFFWSLDPLENSDDAAVIVATDPSDLDGDQLPDTWETTHGLDPQIINAPDSNSDSDWMTDREEYIADTDPTNAASYFPNVLIIDEAPSVPVTSSERIYSTWQTTNLLDEPPTWMLVPPEQTGTGAAISFPLLTNTPTTIYRTGVRLP